MSPEKFLESKGIDVTTVVAYHFPKELPSKHKDEVDIDLAELLKEYAALKTGLSREQHLLLKLSEECAEVSQRCAKSIIFGSDEIQPGQKLNNVERLVNELEDLLGVARMLREEKMISAPDEKNINNKSHRVEHFMELSKQRGKTQS